MRCVIYSNILNADSYSHYHCHSETMSSSCALLRRDLESHSQWLRKLVITKQLEGRRVESTSSHCVAALDKLLTQNCL